MRGVAALSILLAHTLVGIAQVPETSIVHVVQGPLSRLLLSGVDLFFVLSGFLIGGILLDNKRAPNYFKAFWTRRIARILPVLCVLLASFGCALIVRANFDLPQFDIWLLAAPQPPFWTYATFTQNIPIALGGYGGPRWVGITWSLAIEEQFYLLFPFVVYFLSRGSIVAAVVAGIIIAPLMRILISAELSWYGAYVLLPSRMDGLLFGVLVALILRNAAAFEMAKRYRVLLDAIAVLLALDLAAGSFLFSHFPLRHSAVGLLFAIMILRIFLYEPGRYHWIFRSRVLTYGGLISYALYMYHQSINGLLHGFIYNQEPKVGSLGEFGVACLTMVIAVGLASLSYVYLERPIRQLGQRIQFKKEMPPTDPLDAAPAMLRP